MLPGECVGTDDVVCEDGHEPITLKLSVQHSAAGYYLGFFCPQCGPYSRESDYFRKREDAEAALASETKLAASLRK